MNETSLPQLRIKVANHILEHTKAVDVSEKVYEQASAPLDKLAPNCSGGSVSIAFEYLLIVCFDSDLPIPISERMRRLALDRCDADRVNHV